MTLTEAAVLRDAGSPLEGSPEDDTLALLDLLSEAAILANEAGVIVHANPAAESLFGYYRAELVGRHVTVLNAYPPAENERIVAAVLQQLESSGWWQGEWVNRRKDGTSFITSAKIRGMRWKSRRCWLCIQSGIPATAVTATDQERLALATEAAELGIWEWDIPTNAFIYSPRARAICGFPATGEITYEDVVRVTHPEDFPHTSAQASRALDPAVRDRLPFEYRIVRSDGSLRWVRAHGYAVFADIEGETRPLRYIGTLEDVTARVESRLAEREAAQQIRLALESARMAVWSLDIRNRTLSPSPEFNQLHGFDRDARPTAEEVEALYAPGIRGPLQERWQDALLARAPAFEAEYGIIRHGAEVWLQVRCEVSYADDGSPGRAVGIVMDITEQRAVREALRESDARFREAADSAPAPVWMTNRAGKVEFGNRAMAEFAGMSREEILGDRWLELMHPDDIAGVLAARAEAWANNHAPYTVEARFRRADGQWRWLEISSRARRDGEGQFNGYVGLAVDRTEARQALSVLSESEERFRLLAERAPVMIWMSDERGNCQYLNAPLREFWAIDEGEVTAFDWRTTMHPDDAARISGEVVRATDGARPFEVQGRIRNSTGAWRVIRTQGVPRHAANGAFLGMIGVNVDLTELIEAQERQELLLEELNHRVKNTLAVVQGLANQTFRSDAEISTARDVFDARLGALAGAHTILTQSNWEAARLKEIIDQAIRVCGEARTRIRQDGPDVVLSPKEALSMALALHELSTNAVKHGSLSQLDRGKIELRWRLQSGRVLNLDWREVDGPAVATPRRRGFGSTLLERILPRDVQGEGKIVFEDAGLRYCLSFPLESPS